MQLSQSVSLHSLSTSIELLKDFSSKLDLSSLAATLTSTYNSDQANKIYLDNLQPIVELIQFSAI